MWWAILLLAEVEVIVTTTANTKMHKERRYPSELPLQKMLEWAPSMPVSAANTPDDGCQIYIHTITRHTLHITRHTWHTLPLQKVGLSVQKDETGIAAEKHMSMT